MTIRSIQSVLFALILTLCALPVALAQAQSHEHHQQAETKPEAQPESLNLTIPDVTVRNQNGEKVRFYSDLVKDRIVAINFIFTTCTTICPPMGVTFARLQRQPGERAGKEVSLISVSVDPVTDTPERMKAWGAKFGAQPGWTFVTGGKPEIDQLLRALNAYVPRREDHTPIVLIGNAAQNRWMRAYGLASPVQMARLIEQVSAKPEPPATVSPAQKYFTDVVLLNQDGAPMRFYSDLIKNRIVIINSFFTTCTSICPPMNQNMTRIQDALGERLGRDVYLISISVDPQTDTPPKLKEYAAQIRAKPGWYFLTGKKENVDWALYKLGQYVEAKDDHVGIIIIGNEATGMWKKAFGLAKAEALIKLVEEVVNDKPAPGSPEQK